MQAIKHLGGLRVDGVDERVCSTAIGLYCGNAQNLTHADVRERALPRTGVQAAPLPRAPWSPPPTPLAAGNRCWEYTSQCLHSFGVIGTPKLEWFSRWACARYYPR